MAQRKTTVPETVEPSNFLSSFEAWAGLSRDIVLLLDDAGRILKCNDVALAAYGYTREELTRLNVGDLRLPGLRGSVAKDFQKYAGPEGATVRTTNLRKDGSAFPVEVSAKAVEIGRKRYFFCSTRDLTERERVAVETIASEARRRSLFENMLEGFAHCRMIYQGGLPVDFVYLDVNASFERLTGLKDVIGKNVSELIPGIRQTNPELFAAYGRVAAGGAPERLETWVEGLDIWFSVAAYGLEDSCFVAVFDNITERKNAEGRIRRLSQMYATLSATNKAIVHSPSEGELFAEICRATTEYGGIFGATIRIADDEAKLLRVVACSDSVRTAGVGIAASTDPALRESRNFAAIAYRENRTVIVNDMANDPSDSGWQRRGRAAGIRSAATLPLRRGGKPVGVLTLNAREPCFFDPDMLRMLDEMAMDISFALDNFDRGHEHERAVQAMEESEEKFRCLVEQSIAGISIVEGDRYLYVNPRFAEIHGYALAEMVGMRIVDTVTEEDRPLVAENIRKRLTGERRIFAFSFTAKRKDGSPVRVGVNVAPASMEGRPITITMLQDIGERERTQRQIEAYVKQLEEAMVGTLSAVSTMVELRDPYTAGHERRVGTLAGAIGAEMGLPEQTCTGLDHIGRIHDIGKITVPAEILSRPGKLSDIEFSIIKTHPQAGYDVLKDILFPWPVATAVLQHHERLDGSGYPKGLKGDEIILEARVMAVADVVEAIASHRPYRPTLGIEAGLEEIVKFRGLRYDEAAVDACVRLFREKGFRLPE
jgi:PAS domain S-box-containing protein